MKVTNKTNSAIQLRHRHMGIVSICVFLAAFLVMFLFMTPKTSEVHCKRGADGGSCVIKNTLLFGEDVREIRLADLRDVRVGTGIESDQKTCQLLFVTQDGIKKLSKVNTSNCGAYLQMEHKLKRFLSTPDMEEIHLALDYAAFLMVLAVVFFGTLGVLFVFGGARVTVFDKAQGSVKVFRKRFFRPKKEHSSVTMADFMSGAKGAVPGRVDLGAAALDQIEGTGFLSGAMGWYPRRGKQRTRVQAQVKDFLGGANVSTPPPPPPSA